MVNIVDRRGRSTEWYAKRVEYMSQFVTEERFAKMLRVAELRSRYLTVCMENTFHAHNASALVRHCDAFGVQDFHTVETLCKFSPSTDVVQGSDQWITFRRHQNTAAALESFRSDGYRIVATSPNVGDHTPESFDIEAGRFVLVFGTELQGISDEVMEGADEFIRIPMCGFIDSLNVSASAAILLHTLTERMRRSEVEWQLLEGERQAILLDWLMKAVRKSEKILVHFDTL